LNFKRLNQSEIYIEQHKRIMNNGGNYTYKTLHPFLLPCESGLCSIIYIGKKYVPLRVIRLRENFEFDFNVW